jgi:8-oxo-dGTP diphosphatase
MKVNKKQESRPLSADAIVIREGKLLLIKRNSPPFKGRYALPGGHLEHYETVEECVAREVFEETGIHVKPLGVIGVYSDPKRDPRGTVSVAYLCAYESGTAHGGTDAERAVWVDLRTALKKRLAFDHSRMLCDTIRILQYQCHCEKGCKTTSKV